MWCPQCRSDVATEVAADGQSLLCTTCGGEVRKTYAPSLHPDVRRARDVLARLTRESGDIRMNPEEGSTPARTNAAADPAAERTDDPSPPVEPARKTLLSGPAISSAPQEVSARFSEPGGAAPAENGAPAARPRPQLQFRVDAAHPPEAVHAHVGPAQHASHGRRAPAEKSGIVRRDDESHPVIPPPHFDVTAARSKPPGRGESTWGQLLAYIGVAVLTIGTALVLWGYFGGPPAYAPTGWLVTTAGQMLLLLGVITLISGGMQQTTHEVASRVAHLDGRMHRIESAAQELLHGPHFQRSVRRAGSSPDADGGAQALG